MGKQGVDDWDMGTLYFLLNFPVNLNLLLKNLLIIKKERKEGRKEGRKAKEEGPSHRACFMVGS